jgi:hypothetical protein
VIVAVLLVILLLNLRTSSYLREGECHKLGLDGPIYPKR